MNGMKINIMNHKLRANFFLKNVERVTPLNSLSQHRRKCIENSTENMYILTLLGYKGLKTVIETSLDRQPEWRRQRGR